MFDARPVPRVFGCAPGIDFPAAVLRGLETRLANAPPDVWARVTLFVNTTRMARRMRQLFDAGPPRLLPRIRLLGDLDDLLPGAPLPSPTPDLRRKLDLVALVRQLVEAEPALAPESAIFDLVDSLSTLMDEMHGEGVTPADIAALDVSDQSGHWARAQRFIGIVQTYVEAVEADPGPEARQRATVLALATHWADQPPADPVLVVGSTGSRGATQLLMQAVARLPQGAVILPGFDTALDRSVWDTMQQNGRAPQAEDHPQYRFLTFASALGLHPADIPEWTPENPPAPARNRLVSLALRPAPVTDAWRSEGPALRTDLGAATADVTLVEADSPRSEAIAIALRLRQAAQDGTRAALISPDRMLTRQVTAALDRWNILPDDSAGLPLHLSPPGRFLRHVAALLERPLDAEALLTLLKHPLTHTGAGRNTHLLATQRLELQIRADGLPYPEADSLIACATRARPDDPDMLAWAQWVAGLMCGQHSDAPARLTTWVARHRSLSEALSHGPRADADGAEDGTGDLWTRQAGQDARAAMDDLARHAPHGTDMRAADFAALLGGVLRQGEVREAETPHPHIMIWGTLEARVQGAELVILAGLNDGIWPEAPQPDPWLNRKMRKAAGLMPPERRIGLSAHDFQQAIAAPQVWLTRSIRSDDAETVPSRWINRLQNLTLGLAAQGAEDVWAQMRGRGRVWLDYARALDAAPPVPKAHRPAPCPPVAARPRRFSITEIETLIRDPYAIYARHCLRLRPLRPLVQKPDALLRGTVSHDVMEAFVQETLADPRALRVDALLETARAVLAAHVPWPATRALWVARFERAAQWIVETEAIRQSLATPELLERTAVGKLELPSIGTTLRCRADRIDVDSAGQVILYDYKTGAAPTAQQQKHFNKQLVLEAAMVEAGAFAELGPCPVRAAQFLSLGSTPAAVDAPLDEEPPRAVLAALVGLLGAYLEPDKGYPARRAPYEEKRDYDYDHLARFREWEATDPPQVEVLT